jgi:hypothetical protein
MIWPMMPPMLKIPIIGNSQPAKMPPTMPMMMFQSSPKP